MRHERLRDSVGGVATSEPGHRAVDLAALAIEDAAETLGIYGHPDVARWLSPEMDHVPDLAAMRLLL